MNHHESTIVLCTYGPSIAFGAHIQFSNLTRTHETRTRGELGLFLASEPIECVRHFRSMPSDPTNEKRRAHAHAMKEARKGDASQATDDYRAAEKATHDRMGKLRQERLAREAAQPQTLPAKKKSTSEH